MVHADGRIPEQVYYAMHRLADAARSGKGPAILSLAFDRLLSHTSSDDHRLYRPADELALCAARDPLLLLRNRLVTLGRLTPDGLDRLDAAVKDEVKSVYADAFAAEDPDPQTTHTERLGPPAPRTTDRAVLPRSHDGSFAGALNAALATLLARDARVHLFGQDIEDPKGGVFGLTKGLSTVFPGRVVNAPLAEATICGAAAGMALAGLLPVFEIQFIDFAATGFNQIVNQLATMRWRTAGRLTCPVILLAPCGGYVQGAGPWHTQTNEALFAHIPGLRVSMPCAPDDVARTVLTAAQEHDPHLILLPKHLFFKSSTGAPQRSDSVIRDGADVTLVAWGNCVALAQEAAQELAARAIDAEIVALTTLAPLDTTPVTASLAKTGRLVVIHEDNRTCSLGQALIASLLTDGTSWAHFYAAPKLVCRDDVLVPFHPALARAVLPSVEQVVEAALATME